MTTVQLTVKKKRENNRWLGLEGRGGVCFDVGIYGGAVMIPTLFYTQLSATAEIQLRRR